MCGLDARSGGKRRMMLVKFPDRCRGIFNGIIYYISVKIGENVMKFDEYQEKAKKYDFFQETSDFNENGFLEKVLGLVGEAGETADKIKKIIRDKNGNPTNDDKVEIAKELGDTLWYMVNIARYMGFSMSEVAQMNLDKLESRWERNKLHGEGDNR